MQMLHIDSYVCPMHALDGYRKCSAVCNFLSRRRALPRPVHTDGESINLPCSLLHVLLCRILSWREPGTNCIIPTDPYLPFSPLLLLLLTHPRRLPCHCDEWSFAHVQIILIPAYANSSLIGLTEDILSLFSPSQGLCPVLSLCPSV